MNARTKYRHSSDRLNEAYNLSYTTTPEAVARWAKLHDAVPAWVTIPLDTQRGTYSAYFGLVLALRSPRSVPMLVNDCAKYECLARDVFHRDITPELFNG